jgi:transketolase
MTNTSSINKKPTYYEELSGNIRKEILNLIYRTRSPHIGSAFSIVELLVALYFEVLSVNPDDPEWEERDRFILSKGHACAALYAVLFHKNFISREMLDGFAVNGGTLEHHPTRNTKIGIEVSTGSLGHGLSIGVGIAVGAKYDEAGHRTFVLLSDGETNEGDVWESAMFASQHKLDNLTAIVDYNKIQALGRTKEILNLEPFANKWRSFGWEVREIDGHNFEEIINAFKDIPFFEGKPSVIIAHTVKGKGVSFMENKLLWHYRCPNEDEYTKALGELTL